MDISNNIVNNEFYILNEECILSSYYNSKIIRLHNNMNEYEINIKLTVRNKGDIQKILSFLEKYNYN